MQTNLLPKKKNKKYAKNYVVNKNRYTHLYCCLMSRSKGCVTDANGLANIVVVVVE